ncbi:sugar ABC transporter ATP-binding protein [Bauldia sp.]|uniref:sugar ABC transporter ATP-binding protein n=1 Tax=Bauldia sp. TaxID=2575872 RepID=UPI003BACD286
MSPLIETIDITRAFFGVPAVKNLSLQVEEGAVLGLIGENGAGKSTLMNMIGGVLPPTSGEMRYRGEPYAPRSAADATERGIAFIHQELNLFTNLSVAENIYIDGFPTRLGLVDRSAINKRSKDLLDRLELDVSPNAVIDQLPPGERQLVEIAKALHRDAELIIFDEPTTSLTPRETARLFETIRRLQQSGKTIIYISHILGDIKALSSHIAVLRDGELVGGGPAGDFDVPAMIRLMIGRDLAGMFPERSGQPSADEVLSVDGLSQPGIVENVGMRVHRGEILGLFGLMGSGRSELARILFGIDGFETGTIRLNGEVMKSRGIGDRIARGMAFVTENRREEGLLMDSTIAENLSLVAIEDFGRGPLDLLDTTTLEQRTEAIRDETQIKAGDIATQPAKSLSGGNQQKVVIGKWLLSDPRLFIMDEPTRGVDVGAKYEIYSLADRMAANGNGILFISSELEELMGMCDRIAVMSRGEIMGEFSRDAFSEPAILSMAFGESTDG